MNTKISYSFELDGGTRWNYEMTFDEDFRLVSHDSSTTEPKSWTKLGFRQCPNCPLKEDAHPQCPIAKNLDRMVEDSREAISHKRARVTVQTPERTYSKECPTQNGLLALFGLIMATSGCPHLDWLRPLARFHLPFASLEETMFRVLSLQLVHQYFNNRQDSIERSSVLIGEKYSEVEKVNHAFIKRINEYCKGDADKNAIAALDVYVQIFQLESQQDFARLGRYFSGPKQ